MRVQFSEEFKEQAVQKVLNRSDGVRIEEVATSLGVSMSTLSRWTTSFRRTTNGYMAADMVKKNTEKRPEDWTREQRFNAIIACHGLTEEQMSVYCRTQGIYAHHIDQWKLDFIGDDNTQEPAHAQQKVRQLSQLNQKLKRDLTRKDKALAETAALLVLQKKVHDIWSDEEDI